MKRFKVGDKVKVKHGLSSAWRHDVLKYIGTTQEIVKVYDNGQYILSCRLDRTWNDNELDFA